MRCVTVTASLLASLMLAGCGTYIEARSNIAPGGKIDQQKASAARDLDAAQAQRAALQQRRAEQDELLARLDDQLRRLQSERTAQQKQLAKAMQAQRISKARHDELSKQLESVDVRMADLQMKVGIARLEPESNLQSLELQIEAEKKKHAELKTMIAVMTGS